MPNQFNVDYAFPGLSSLCHDEIADFEGSRQVRAGIFRPIIKRIKGIARELDIKLDDGSTMKVAMCKKCYSDFKPEDVQELMESEINGWQHEVDEVVDWKDDKKINHMKKYSERFVTDRIDDRWTNIEKSRIKKPRADKLKVRVK